MHGVWRPQGWPLVVLLPLLVGAPHPAGAHERREVGAYQLVVGFLTEPAFEGLKNGVDLRVLDRETQQPVEGLERTLQVELTYVPSGAAKVLRLRTIYREPGHYTADLIPTVPGHYRFRFFGSLAETAINETFDSRAGGGQFDDVDAAADLQFQDACLPCEKCRVPCGAPSRRPSRPRMLRLPPRPGSPQPRPSPSSGPCSVHSVSLRASGR